MKNFKSNGLLWPFRFALAIGLMILTWGTCAAKENLPEGWPWRGVSIGFPAGKTEDLVRYKKVLKVNFVRLNINVRLHANNRRIGSEQAWQSAMVWTDSMLEECARLGIRATVEVNQFPLDPSLPDRMHTERFWESASLQNELIWAAGRLAERYSQRGNELSAYQILSEPLLRRNGRSMSPPQWKGALENIVSEIRKFDKKRWIVISPGSGGGPGGYANFQPPTDSRLIWGAHMYLPHAFTHQGLKGRARGVVYPGRIRGKYWDKSALREALAPLKQFQKKHSGPIFIGEFSAVRWASGGELYVRDLAAIFDENNWGWTYFSATGWHGMNPDYDDKFSSDNPKEWKSHFVGDTSPRWQTLRSIFKVEQGIHK